MNLRNVKVLGGPNVWARSPVLEIELEIVGPVPALPDRLARDWGVTTTASDPAVQFAKVLAAGACWLQQRAGSNVQITDARRRSPERIDAAVEFAFEPIARASLEIAWRMLTTGANQWTSDDQSRLKELGYQHSVSPTVGTTVEGARRLGIPVAKLSAEYNGYFVLGQGSKQHRLRWSEPDTVSGVARLASTDKYLTNQLLASIGVPVPRGRLINQVADAWKAANEVGLPVAVKPYNTDLQTGVSLDLHTQERVEAAFHSASEHSSWILVEHFAPGVEHRVVVIGERVAAVTRIEPPHVDGDGRSTIAELVEAVNKEPRRGGDEWSDAPLAKLKIDDIALAVLASQGFTLASVPPQGQRVLVRRDPPYFKNGGTLTDLTDEIHPSIAAHAVAAARMMQIPVAGLDVVALDISKPLEAQEGIIVEINANPGFWLHLAPWADRPRPLGEMLVAWHFPNGETGRIPVVGVFGGGGTTAQRTLAGLESVGLRAGFTSSRETILHGRRWQTPPGTPQDRAYLLFRNPMVDAALFEIDAADLQNHGFPSDRCEIALLLGPPPKACDFLQAIVHALAPTGLIVTSWPTTLLPIEPARIVWIGADASAGAEHRARGGKTVHAHAGQWLLHDGARPPQAIGAAVETSESEAAAAVAVWTLRGSSPQR